jgi:hypothetical protein
MEGLPMKFLFFIANAAANSQEAAQNGGTQGAFDNALWQYPVAALVIFIVIIFLRDRKKSDERHEKFLTETNQLDREDRKQAQDQFADMLMEVRDRSSNNTRVLVDTFTKQTEEATKNSNALTARAIDTIDRNTEAFGEVKALLRTMTGQFPAIQDTREARERLRSREAEHYADYDDESEDSEEEELKPKKRTRKPRKRSNNRAVKSED